MCDFDANELYLRPKLPCLDMLHFSCKAVGPFIFGESLQVDLQDGPSGSLYIIYHNDISADLCFLISDLGVEDLLGFSDLRGNLEAAAAELTAWSLCQPNWQRTSC